MELSNKKGFSKLSIQGLQLDNLKVYELIKDIDINTLNLNLEDQKIAIKIKQSFHKINNNQKLSEDDLVLEQFELLEFSKLEKKNYIRYLIYRYKYKILPKLF